MSWGHCGEDSKGRPIGYAVSAKCDCPGCDADIDRGLAYACGGMHGKTELGCEEYFCETHLYYTVEDKEEFTRICTSCMLTLTTSGEWALNPEDWVIRRIVKP
jgi:hypothetical protein